MAATNYLLWTGEILQDPQDGKTYLLPSGIMVEASAAPAGGNAPTSTIYGPLVGCLGGPV